MPENLSETCSSQTAQHLSLREIVQLEAAYAFAKLARGRNRPRRRRERNRTGEPSYPGNNQYPKPSTMDSKSTSPYSHIKIVPQETLADLNRGSSKTPPTVSKPSFQYDADVAVNTKCDPIHQSTDSLAGHATGATFASKARAAELKAAQARKELTTRSNDLANSVPDGIDAPRKMPSSKSKLMWKKVNLGDLIGSAQKTDDTEDDVDLPTHNEPAMEDEPMSQPGPDGVMTTQTENLSTGRFDLSDNISTMPSPNIFQPKNEHFESQGNLTSMNPFHMDQVSTNYVSNEVGFSNVLPANHTHTPANTSFQPQLVPYEGRWAFEDQAGLFNRLSGHYGSLEEEYQPIQPRIPHLQSRNVDPPGLFDCDWHEEEFQLIQTRIPSLQSRNMDLRVSANEALRNTHPFKPQPTSSGPFETAPKSYITQLRAKPPHFYPAVRGTKGDHKRTFTVDQVDQGPVPTQDRSDGNSKIPRFDSGAEYSNYQTEYPYPLEYPPKFFEPSDGATSQNPSYVASGQDFQGYSDDDNLSWRQRQAPIVSPTPQSMEVPTLFGYRMTSQGCFPVDADERKLSRSLALNHERRGSTAQPKRDINNEIVVAQDFARNELQKLRAKERAQMDALRAANFSDDQPDSAQTSLACEANDHAIDLLLPALMQLSTYRPGSRYFYPGNFYRMGKAPEWCFDQGPDGNKSFFGGDWGTPPARVGRDPRYQPLPDAPARKGDWLTGREGRR